MTSKVDKTISVKLQLTLTDAQGVMYDSGHEWHHVPLAGAVYIEQKLLDLLTELHGWGKDMARGNMPDIQL